MKKLLFGLFLLSSSLYGAGTRNIVPRANNEGSIGTPSKQWASVYAGSAAIVDKVYVGSITAYGTVTSTSGFIGSGNGLTNIPQSSFAGSEATSALNMGNFPINNSSTITAFSVWVSSGHVGSPGFAFEGSTMTGIYFDPSAGGSVHFVKNSVDQPIEVFSYQTGELDMVSGGLVKASSFKFQNSGVSSIGTGSGNNGIDFRHNQNSYGAILNSKGQWIFYGASNTVTMYGAVTIASSAITDWVALSVSSTPDPSSRFYILSSTGNWINVPVIASSITSLGTITGSFKGDGGGITGIPQYNTTGTWSATQNFTNPINILNTHQYPDATVDATLYSLYSATGTANSVYPAMYGFAVNTGDTPGVVGHYIGVLGRSSDTEQGHTQLFGFEGRVDLSGDSVYHGSLSYTNAKFSKVTGSTATMYGAEARCEVFGADGATPNATGTVVALYIPAIIGGATDRKWSIYQSGTADPAYFSSPIGIGIPRPYGTGTLLQIGAATTPSELIISQNAGAVIGMGASNAAGGYTWIGSTSPHILLFAQGNAEAMRIDTSKNVGINNTSPSNKLSVVGTVDVSSLAVPGVISSSSGFKGNIYNSTITKSITLETPAVGNNPFFFKAQNALTISNITCISSAATSTNLQLQNCDKAGINCAAVEATITCGTTETTVAGGDVDTPSVAAGNRLRLMVHAISGTPGWVTMDVSYRETAP